jgi:hypothetical protein
MMPDNRALLAFGQLTAASSIAVLVHSASQSARSRAIPKCSANFEAKESGICVNESRSQAPVAAVSVNEPNVRFAHFPSLLENPPEHVSPHNLSRVIPVQVNRHLRTS